MSALHWMMLAVAGGFAILAINEVCRTPTLHHDDPDGLSDDEREALRIIRERDA